MDKFFQSGINRNARPDDLGVSIDIDTVTNSVGKKIVADV